MIERFDCDPGKSGLHNINGQAKNADKPRGQNR
jgi:hypothetical protein